MSLPGPRTVLVSGGTYGIGRAITLRLARAGHRVVAFGLDSRQPGSTATAGVAATCAELARLGVPDRDVWVTEADVSDDAAVHDLVHGAVARFGPVDALVNNAAIRVEGDALTVDLAAFDRSMAVNARGPLVAARAVLPGMLGRGRGRIVNIGSGSAAGRANLVAYTMSKAAVHALTTSLALDFGHRGVAVNTVVPRGLVPSGMTESMGAAAGSPVTGADIAAMVEYLLSDDAAQVSGSLIEVGPPAGRTLREGS